MGSNFGIPYHTKTGGNGGVNQFEQRHTAQGWAKPDPVRRSTDCVVAGGYVIPAFTWLMLRDDGKVIPHNGMNYITRWSFEGSIHSGGTLTFTNDINGFAYTYTAPHNMSASELMSAVTKDAMFMSLLTDNNVAFIISGNTLEYTQLDPAKPFNTSAINVTITTNSANLVIARTVLQGRGDKSAPIAGLLAFDVCAFDSAGANAHTPAQMFVAGSRYNTSVRWASNANETLTDAWGNVHAVSPYNTGVTNMIAANAFCVQSDFEIRETREG